MSLAPNFTANLAARAAALALAAGLALCTTSAQAGPPFLTDDPEPTTRGHWEIYGPFIEVDGTGADYSGTAGVELNYGAAENLQLTLALPAAFAHDAAGTDWAAGDIKVSAKYRILNSEKAHVQAAFFPGLTLPTASRGLGAGRVTALLPVWVQKDAGQWSIFGGGGYAINPGPDRRNYWTGGIAITRQLGERLLLGLEADRSGADEDGARPTSSLGIGVIYDVAGPLRLLASGGPNLPDGGGRAGFHAFLALGWDY